MKVTGVSPGISIGSARWVVRQRLAPTGILIDGPEAIRAEVEKFRAAVTSAVAEVEALINTSTPGISAEPAATPPQSAEAGVPALPAEPAALPTPSTEPAVPAQSAEAAAILETHIAMLT